MYLGHLLFKQAAQESFVGTAHDDFGITVGVVHTLYDGAYHVALVEEVGRYLLFLGHYQLVLVLVHEQHLALPYLVHLAGDDFALYL